MTSKRLAAVAAVMLILVPVMAPAGAISRACLASNRAAASKQLCGCIQKVANKSLSRADRRLAASFFADPQKAHEVRFSDNPRDEAFWDRYEAFGNRAARTCR